MSEQTNGPDPAQVDQWHRFMAGRLFNEAWAYLDRPERTPEEDQQMLWAAMGSRYHWLQVGDEKNFAIGDWQLSRIYSVMEDLPNARRYAAASLRRCHHNDLGPFLTAYAHEALARVAALANDAYERDRNRDDARALADQIEDEEDRAVLLDDRAAHEPRQGSEEAAAARRSAPKDSACCSAERRARNVVGSRRVRRTSHDRAPRRRQRLAVRPRRIQPAVAPRGEPSN